MKSVHYLVGEAHIAINGIDGCPEFFVEHLDSQRKRSAVPVGDEPATFVAGRVVKFKHRLFYEY
jgi:hypothetical protein